MADHHYCDRNYCSKCHRDRVREARAQGRREGLEHFERLWWKQGTIYHRDLKEARAQLDKDGTLPGEAADAR